MPVFDVFISHSSKDKTIADATCAALENAGIRCWVAPRDIRPGVDWDEAIVQAIDRCRVMVLIFSGEANGSRHVAREVKRAFSKDVPVVPIRVEKVQPSDMLGYYLDNVHWLDAFSPPLQEHLGRLAQLVKAIVAADAEGTAVESGTKPDTNAALPPEPPQPYEMLRRKTARARIGDAVPAGPAPTGTWSRLRWYCAGSLITIGTMNAILWINGFAEHPIPLSHIDDVYILLTFVGDLFAICLGVSLVTMRFFHPKLYLALTAIAIMGYFLFLFGTLDHLRRGGTLDLNHKWNISFLLEPLLLLAYGPTFIYLVKIVSRRVEH